MSILARAKLYQISTSTNFLTEGEETSFDQGIRLIYRVCLTYKQIKKDPEKQIHTNHLKR